MRRKYFLILLAVLAVSFLYGAPECFSVNGIAGNFTDVDGTWKNKSAWVALSEIPGGLRFVFHTGVRGKDYFFKKASHDSPGVVTQGESLELQLVPDPASDEYFHIGINPAGELYTARRRDTSWEPRGLKADVRDWSRVTIDISYADLGRSKVPVGTAWRVNFCHNRASKGEQGHSSWAGVKDFHDIKNYGILRFGSFPGPAVIVEEQSVLSARARVVNGSGTRLELVQDGRIWPAKVAAGGTWLFSSRSSELPLKSLAKRTFRLRDQKGKILWEQSALANFDNRSCLETDRYYYSFKDLKLTWKSSLPGKKEFFLSGPRSRKWSSGQSSGSILLPEAEGRYLLTVKSGTKRFSRVVIVKEFVPQMGPGGNWSSKEGFLWSGGKRRFLTGISPTGRPALQGSACFNLGQVPAGLVPGALKIASLGGKKLHRAAAATGYVFKGGEKETLAFFRKEAVKLNSLPLQISRIAYEAQLKSYFPFKGKLLEQDSARLYRKIYEEMKKYAPGQLFSLQIDNQKQTSRFKAACDVFEIAVTGSYTKAPLPRVAEEIRRVRSMVPDKALLHWFGVSIPDGFSRSAEELRAELFCAFINNSAGAMLHLGHGGIAPERSRLWSVVSGAGAELDELMEEFHSAAALPVAEPAGFQAALRDCGRYYLIVAVNCSNAPARMKLLLPGKRVFSALFSDCEARVFRVRK